MGNLPPKPPPISQGMTVTLPMGTCRTSATWERIWKAPWVLTQTVIEPSCFHRTVVLWGSM